MSPSIRPRAAATLPAALVGVALLLPGAGTAAAAEPAPRAGAEAQARAAAEKAAGKDTARSAAAEAAATWAADQLSNGGHVSRDHGLTADIVLGLAASGTAGATAERATNWLQTNARDYLTPGKAGDVSATGAAKLALVAAAENRDPEHFGDHNLIEMLKGSLQKDGRFKDTAASDTHDQYTQPLGILALSRFHQVPKEAVDFLLKSRCEDDGGFPLQNGPDAKACVSDTGSTGMAVQALYAAGRPEEAKRALDRLERTQLPDGGFAATATGREGDSRSTALGVQALLVGKRAGAANKGLAWLRTRQLGCSAAPADRGAIGSRKAVVDRETLRVTAQVVPALAEQSLAEIDGRGSRPGRAALACGTGTTTGGTGTTGGTTGKGTSSTSPSPSRSASPSPSPSSSASASASASASPGTTSGDSSTGGSGTTGTGSTGSSASSTDNLAATGADSALPAAAGAGALLLTGAAAVTLSRRMRRTGA
ncbi:prenyltransferase/squalene oxidase repeat-containing protein [Streptomyces sp. ISL-11]|uniref:prenyltransferase/squalene oxidase repeat-containing protein n=1 Tax=Streptomyces sp. ISL-11 TaxID=2819174 RepID=UPI001BECDACE|nr:prenyltransferase/squalene oxidase repeat-containing protein [Streptomyces sp. ISL-11]MBT2385932.1 hypothetical protein [Streptomyces sp. ISL-11]